MKGKLVTIHRRVNELTLYVRTENGEKRKLVVKDFYPYFYVPDESGEYVSIFGERLRKIKLVDPSKVRDLRKKFDDPHEADIPYTRRFLIDTGIMSGLEFPDGKEVVSHREIKPADVDVELKCWYIDIEVLMEGSFPDVSRAENPIISWTIYDGRRYITAVWRNDLKPEYVENGNWVVLKFKDEYNLLFALVRLLARGSPDILVGWNIYEFDEPYLRHRCSNLNIPLNLDPVEVFDMYLGYKHLYKQPSYALKKVAVYEGILDKEEHVNVDEMYYEDLNALIEYNKRDVEIMVKLDEKHEITKFHQKLREACGLAHLEDTLHMSVIVDTLLLREAKKLSVVLPTSMG